MSADIDDEDDLAHTCRPCHACNKIRRKRTNQQRAYWALQRRVAEEQGQVFIVAGIKHGISGYENFSCRCEVCVEAKRVRDRGRKR